MALYAAYPCPGLPGDLLLFRRGGLYSHYAVNVGDGDIVHVTSATPEDFTSMDVVESSSGFFCSSSSLGAIAVVKREPYVKFKKPGDDVIVEDGQWNGKTALERLEIVHRALSRVGEVGYNLLFKNCEHFARWCRYGEEKSDQAMNFGIGLGVAAGVGAVLLGLGAAAYLLSDSEEEKKRKQRYSRQ